MHAPLRPGDRRAFTFVLAWLAPSLFRSMSSEATRARACNPAARARASRSVTASWRSFPPFASTCLSALAMMHRSSNRGSSSLGGSWAGAAISDTISLTAGSSLCPQAASRTRPRAMSYDSLARFRRALLRSGGKMQTDCCLAFVLPLCAVLHCVTVKVAAVTSSLYPPCCNLAVVVSSSSSWY